MATTRAGAAKILAPMTGTVAVDAFFRALRHPLGPALALVRTTILAAGPKIEEGIKWNSPSFREKTPGTWFATINTHQKAKVAPCILIVLHRGAKVKRGTPAPRIPDPAGLLEWLGTDRCTMRFADLREVKARQAALRNVVRHWVAQR